MAIVNLPYVPPSSTAPLAPFPYQREKELALWLCGVIDVLDETPPNAEQWARIRERITAEVGKLMAERMLHGAAMAQSQANFSAKAVKYNQAVDAAKIV